MHSGFSVPNCLENELENNLKFNLSHNSRKIRSTGRVEKWPESWKMKNFKWIIETSKVRLWFWTLILEFVEFLSQIRICEPKFWPQIGFRPQISNFDLKLEILSSDYAFWPGKWTSDPKLTDFDLKLRI